MTTTAELEQRLGYFGPFMAAWGKATPETRAQLFADAVAYESGRLSADDEVREASTLLGIPIPAGW